ncbi:MAG: hypothetical protein P8O03_06695 [Ilumatobacter sp.]|nr:hypothetical protein [Ilumatobacter sp.]
MTRSAESIDPPVAIRAAVDVLVFAPLGLGAKLVEDAPDAVDRARRELSNARFIGRLAVDQGIKQIRSRFEPSESSPTQSANNGDVSDDFEPLVRAGEIRGSNDLMTRESVRSDLVAGDLALPDYDTLPAIDIVGKLATLDDVSRDAIERYELANRQRRTVLGKLAQLAEG